MPGLYDTFRDRAQWERFVAASDEIPGLEEFEPAVEIRVRYRAKLTDLGEDVEATGVYWTFPADEVKVGDRLDGRPVVAREEPEDAAGRIMFGVCYVTG